jgi:hypothetical protein
MKSDKNLLMVLSLIKKTIIKTADKPRSRDSLESIS